MSQIDTREHVVVRTISVGDAPVAIATGFGAVWVANRESDSVSVIDARTGAVVQTIPVGDAPNAIAVGAGAVWVAGVGGTVSKIVPR